MYGVLLLVLDTLLATRYHTEEHLSHDQVSWKFDSYDRSLQIVV